MQNLFQEVINIKQLSDIVVESKGAKLRINKLPFKYREKIRVILKELPEEFDKHIELLDNKKSDK